MLNLRAAFIEADRAPRQKKHASQAISEKNRNNLIQQIYGGADRSDENCWYDAPSRLISETAV